MRRLDSFLYFLPLEVCGLVFGWIGLVFNILCIAILAIVAIVIMTNISTVLGLGFLTIMAPFLLSAFVNRHFITGINTRDHTKMRIFRIGFNISTCATVVPLVYLVIYLLFNPAVEFSIFAMINFLLKLGLDEEPSKMGRDMILGAILWISVHIYIAICINSLYMKIKETKSRLMTLPTTMQQPGHFVVSYQSPPAAIPQTDPSYQPTFDKY